MSRYRLSFVLFVLVVTLTLLVFAPSARPVAAQDGNLLANPSFEGNYSAYYPRTAREHADCPHGICNTVQIPSGWSPWWAKEQESDANPEYKPATPPFHNRIHSGERAGQYFTFYRTHKAGFYQQVNVPANAVVQFSIWGQAWVTNSNDLTSDPNASINMRIGIDPTGGTDPYSGNIVWSDTKNPFDNWAQFVVQAQAQGSTVTVFTHSDTAYALKHNDVYWDDAALVVVGEQAAPPPSVVPAPAPVVAVPGTHVVQGGETLYGIAGQYGVLMQELAAYNLIENPAVIRVGQVLRIPGGAAPVTAPAPAPGPAPTVEGVTATTIANLRLRSGPDTTFEILGTAPFGTTVQVLGRDATGTWIQVSYQGQMGWMAAQYTRLSGGTLDELAVVGV